MQRGEAKPYLGLIAGHQDGPYAGGILRQPPQQVGLADACLARQHQDSAEPGAELPENRREPVTLSSASDVARHRRRAHVRQSAATLATASALTWMMRTDASALLG